MSTRQLGQHGLCALPIGAACGITDIGPVRSNNEDSFLIDSTLGLAAVADGMGGHAGGAVASAAALIAMQQYLRRLPPLAADCASDHAGDADATTPHAQPAGPAAPDWNASALARLHAAVAYANLTIHAQNLALHCRAGGMGTTLTGIWTPRAGAGTLLFHVGDSRLYRQRADVLTPLTRDHTLYQEALDRGLIDNLPARNLLMQAVGPAASVMPEIRLLSLLPDDLLMICSDGLHGGVPHGEIEAVLCTVRGDALEAACTALVALAKQYGGRDNITVLLVRCGAHAR
ncbi:MAG: protein phosphatase 2C domain-containing protein [Pseudomonadota bacterium]